MNKTKINFARLKRKFADPDSSFMIFSGSCFQIIIPVGKIFSREDYFCRKFFAGKNFAEQNFTILIFQRDIYRIRLDSI